MSGWSKALFMTFWMMKRSRMNRMGATCAAAQKREGSQPVVVSKKYEAPGDVEPRMPQLNPQRDVMPRCHSNGELMCAPTTHPGWMQVRFSP